MSNNKLLKNIFSVGAIQIANYLFPLLTVPVVSRIIGPEKFGIINFANAFVLYFVLFIGYGFDLTATRKIAREPGNQENRSLVFSQVFQTQIILLLISTLVFTVFLFRLPQLSQEKPVAIYTFLTCVASVLTQNWLFQAMQDLSKVAILSLISKVVFTICILLIIHKRSDYVWQPLALSLSSILVSVVSFWWSIKRYHLKLRFVGIGTCFRLLWTERFFFISMVVINLYTTTNVVILGLYQNATEVGYYTAGQRLISIFQSVLSMTLAQAFFPFLGKAFGESYEKGISTAQKVLPLVMVTTGALVLVLFLAGPIALQILYGPAFSPAVNVFHILAATPLIIAFSTVLGIHVMMNLKMDALFFRITCVGAVVSIVLNILFVRPYGYMASAYILVTTELVIAILFYASLKRKGIEIITREFFSVKSIYLTFSSVLKKMVPNKFYKNKTAPIDEMI